MRRILTLLVLLTFLPRLALADPPAPVTAVPPGDDVITVVKKGDPAPYTGQLFDQATALRWANFLQQYKFRLGADVDLQKKLDDADLTLQKQLLVIEQQKYVRVTDELQAKNVALQKQLADPPFYDRVWFGVALGAVAMGLAVGLSAWGLSSAR
jgi:hypothetical protein